MIRKPRVNPTVTMDAAKSAEPDEKIVIAEDAETSDDGYDTSSSESEFDRPPKRFLWWTANVFLGSLAPWILALTGSRKTSCERQIKLKQAPSSKAVTPCWHQRSHHCYSSKLSVDRVVCSSFPEATTVFIHNMVCREPPTSSATDSTHEPATKRAKVTSESVRPDKQMINNFPNSTSATNNARRRLVTTVQAATLLKTQQPNLETATKSDDYAHFTARDQNRLQRLGAAIETEEGDPRSALAQEFRRQDKKDCMNTPESDMWNHHRNAATNCGCSLVSRHSQKHDWLFLFTES